MLILCLLRVVIEHLLEVNRCLRLCYICCTGAFGGVEHIVMAEMFADIQVDVGGEEVRWLWTRGKHLLEAAYCLGYGW